MISGGENKTVLLRIVEPVPGRIAECFRVSNKSSTRNSVKKTPLKHCRKLGKYLRAIPFLILGGGTGKINLYRGRGHSKKK